MTGGDDRPKPTDARFALAENVKYLMDAHRSGFQVGISPRDLERALQGTVSYKSIQRMCDPYSVHSPSLEHIDAVARFFNVETWLLLRRRPSSPNSQAVEVTPPPKSSPPRR